MKDGFLKTAAATPLIRVADCGFNAQQIMKIMDRAAQQGVRLLVLPELCITGYTCSDLFLQESLLDSAWQALLQLAEQA